MTDILNRLTDYIAKCPSANGRTFHEMDEEVLIAQSADEIVKLRTALQEKDNIAYIIDSHGVTHRCFTIVYRSALENWRQEARAALEGKDD